jgi:hypothetical protein
VKKSRPIKAIGRKRRAAGGMLLSLGLLIAGVWVASRWWHPMVWFGDRWILMIWRGQVTLNSLDVPEPSQRYRLRVSRAPEWARSWQWITPVTASNQPSVKTWFYCRGRVFLGGAVDVLLWPIPLLLWTPAALLLHSSTRARKRASKGQCKSCGYSLAGLTAATPCPECGKATEAPSLPPS